MRVWALELLNNGDLASASDDKTIRIWDVDCVSARIILNGHTDVVRGLKVLPNGDLASGSFDGTIKIWDVEKGTVQSDLKVWHVDETIKKTFSCYLCNKHMA